jgi:hypothetical protein
MNATSADALTLSRTGSASTHTESLPGLVYLAIAGLACLPIGLLWDISHHSTIGRDTFWTPAHILIQLGGIVPALLFGSIALKTTFRGTPEERDASVSFWGFRAPLGVWVTVWGALAMVTSAPFDDWWHNRYGLDVRIVSPPHAVLGLGMFAVGMGVLLFVFSRQNRASGGKRNGLLCALAVGVMIALWADFATEFTWPNLQHAAYFYSAVSTPFPLLLLLAARASNVRGGATIAAATYTLIYIGMILVLPLFPAHPKLAPVYHPVDHMVPPAFPLLLIAPAIAIDLIHGWINRSSRSANGQAPPADSTVRRPRWWRDWLLALLFAAVFLAIMFAVQWPFSTFLLSDAADNRFFARSGHWPYFARPGDWMNRFFDFDKDPITLKGIALAFLRAFISTRIGLLLGSYLLRLKR